MTLTFNVSNALVLMVTIGSHSCLVSVVDSVFRTNSFSRLGNYCSCQSIFRKRHPNRIRAIPLNKPRFNTRKDLFSYSRSRINQKYTNEESLRQREAKIQNTFRLLLQDGSKSKIRRALPESNFWCGVKQIGGNRMSEHRKRFILWFFIFKA